MGLVLGGLAGFQGTALAQTQVNPATIVRIHTGWGSDQFRIETSAGRPVVNPAGCSTPDGYISHISQPGFQTHYRLVLEAYARNKPVYVTVSNTACWNDRPVILGLAF
ncbi:hypothetical protein WA016_01594 [Myxococcus stipitatus]